MQTETRTTKIADAILDEMDQEAEITKRLLDVIPEKDLSWRPHPKAKSLGELAMHVATIQGAVAEIGQQPKEAGDFPPDIEATSRAEIIDAFAASLSKAKAIVSATDDTEAVAEWTLTKDGNTILAMPRSKFWRSILLNHYYHHRGQLSTYIRQLDVPLPSIYGPSADADPFA